MKTTFYWLKLPLLHPYRLSFKTIKEYDSFIFLIKTNDNIYWGESTALYGYSWETAESIWDTIVRCIDKSQKDLQKLKIEAENLVAVHPFASSSVLIAIEKYGNLVKYEKFNYDDEFPLTGTIRGRSPDELTEVVNELTGSGYKVLKMKLSKDVNYDIKRIKAVQNILHSDISLRLDANQSYNNNMVEHLLSNIKLESIELLEQPFKRDSWQLVESLVKWSPVPVMLDESIWLSDDIRKASKCGVKYVKLKLVKHGSISNTVALSEEARRLGINVILGNGVQTDLGCIDECYVYKLANLREVGEMNGFLKLQTTISSSCIVSENGIAFINIKNAKKSCLNIANDYVFKEYSAVMKG